MCTLVILRRPGHCYPLILGANRDEMVDRPWRAPARHWPDRPDIVAGLDLLAGGTWLGLNDHGVAAGILNRTGTLGPMAGRRSRGELVLEALDHADAASAAAALTAIEPRSYRPFNLVIADNRDAFWVRHADPAGIAPATAISVKPGISMIAARELDDTESPRIRVFMPRFRGAPAPNPETGDWTAWERLLGAGGDGSEAGWEIAMNFVQPNGFGTVASSLIALPSPEAAPARPIFRFISRRPQSGEWTLVHP